MVGRIGEGDEETGPAAVDRQGAVLDHQPLVDQFQGQGGDIDRAQVQEGDAQLLAGHQGDAAAVEDLLLDQVLDEGLAPAGGVGEGALGARLRQQLFPDEAGGEAGEGWGGGAGHGVKERRNAGVARFRTNRPRPAQALGGWPGGRAP